MGILGFNIKKIPYLVLFVLLAGIGIGVASAIATITIAGDLLVTGDAELEGKLLDTNDDAGTAGQVLSSTETGIDWINTVLNDKFLINNKAVEIPPGTSIPGCENTNSCYIPFSTEIHAGGNVIWTNFDAAAHTVTSGNPADGPDGLFDSSLIAPGDTFSHQFTHTGTFEYFCVVHPWQIGEVVVTTPSNNRIVDIPPGTSIPGCENTNSCFIPFSTEIKAGGNILWVNRDTAAHTVTSGNPTDGPDGNFDSGLISSGSAFSVKFDGIDGPDEPGEYPYFCLVHPWQLGEVVVNS